MKEGREARPARNAGARADVPRVMGAASRKDASLRDEDRFNAVFETSSEALVIVSRRGIFKRANRRAEQLLRSCNPSRGSTQLESLFQKSVPVTRRLRTDENSSGEAAHFEAVLRTGSALRFTLRSILAGGGDLLLCLEDPGAANNGGQAQAELQALVESVDAGTLLLDLAGNVRSMNARFLQLFSLEPQTPLDPLRWEDLAARVAGRFQNPESFSAPWKAFQGGGSAAIHSELEISQPARRILKRYSRAVLDSSGQRAGWLELFTDVTGERQIQSKMIQTEKMAALGLLVSGIAHELNNPLTGIMGYAQLLLGQNLPPAQRAEAAKVWEEAERARHIVKNLLCFARESKREYTRVQINEVVERTLALRSYELKVENIAVDRDLDPELPETMADPHQLQQVVLNLLVNAEQALLESCGQGRIILRTRRLGSQRVALEVADDGPGIATENLNRVFDPFFTTKAPGIGTGLGLSIVYGIVQQHGGEVAAENLTGGGMRFTVELPLQRVAASAPAAEGDAASGPRRQISSGRILVVEDEPTVAQLIADVLREEGHAVEATLDSQEGLTLLSRRRFDLVICDLRMPRLDGTAFYDALVHSGSPLQRSILFVTGDTLAARTQEFLDGRRLPYLAKPFLVEELKLAVNRILETNGGEAGGTSSFGRDLATQAASK
ncbi:MAG TPA: ATP-binding protein [Verrucomicrobiae bacterium]|nr:ATP-binding protein [Verrucomicrobiae bacterium]